jgi:MHS family proline/betaine transporter-like MFS transporter
MTKVKSKEEAKMSSPNISVPLAAPSRVVSISERRRAFIGASVGNAVEWYEYAVYGSLAVFIGALFFPSNDPATELLSSFAVFGISFLARPFGGLFFGSLADRIGRKKVMVAVLTMMSVATALIGMLPTYASIGVIAPGLLVLMRCIQGLSAGGEFGSATTFMMEYAGEGRRGLSTSWLMVSSIVGFISGAALVAGLVLALDSEAMNSWGWRIPFIIALPLGGVVLYVRMKLEETPAFQQLAKRGHVSRAPLRDVFGARRSLLSTFCIATLHSTCFYVIFTFLVGHISRTLQQGNDLALLSTVIAGGVAVLILPFAGLLSDFIGRRALLLTGGIGFLLFSYPIFALISTGEAMGIIMGHTALAVLLAIFGSTSVVTMTEVFPVRVRSVGVSVGYSLPNALFGGMAPFFATYLVQVTGDVRSPALYLMATAAIAVAALLIVYRKDLGSDTEKYDVGHDH